MNTDSYWKDPFEFKPERFIDEEGNLINHDNFAPFGYGITFLNFWNINKEPLM